MTVSNKHNAQLSMSVDIPAIVAGKRGSRFAGDKPSMALYIGRSKNGNIVVYDVKTESSAEHGGSKLAVTDTVDAHWLDLDPAYAVKHKANGNPSCRDELNFVDRWQAYGVKVCEPTPKTARLEFVAIPKKVTMLHLERAGDGRWVPIVRCQISGVDNAVLEHIWVEVEDGWLGVPKVKYVDLSGTHPTTGAFIKERITT
jgi:hypothetical protein